MEGKPMKENAAMEPEVMRAMVKALFDALETMAAGRPFALMALNIVEQMVLGLVGTGKGLDIFRAMADRASNPQ